MTFSRDGKLLLTASEDHTARLWDTATGKPVGKPMLHKDIVKDAAISPDGKFAATACRDGTARLWQCRTGQPTGTVLGHQGSANAVAFSPDSNYFATGGNDGMVYVWETATAATKGMFRHPAVINQVAFLRDGRTLVTCCGDGRIRKWDINARKETGLLCAERIGVTSLSLGLNDRLVLTGSRDRGLQLWESISGKALTEPISKEIYFTDVSLSPDGKTFATAGNQKLPGTGIGAAVAQVWDVTTERPIGAPIPDKNGVAIHPSGMIIATAGDDGIVQLWDINARRHERDSVRVGSVDALWKDLLSDDVPRAFRAVSTLSAMPQESVAFIEMQLKRGPGPDEKRIQKLIVDLDDDSFEVREKAEKELAAMDRAADPLLRTALAKNPPAEVQQRLQRILDPLRGNGPGPEQLRLLRSIQVLEEIGTVQARGVLQNLAKGIPEADLTREAKAALERLAARP
jgi:dipeptidyl aminopeptidase/acylaminoacyl peptidase